MAPARPPPYKQFLTPALHRRFTGAAVVILAICYVEAVLIGDKTSVFWSWFPIGSAGIKTLLLFVSALSVFVLRVGQLHLGARITPSPATTFSNYLLRFDTFQTFAWYLFSAWWFSEAYFWSASGTADLAWISQGKSWERRKLNERPIYLRSVLFIFATVQAILHIYYDYDDVTLSSKRPEKADPTPEVPPKLVASLKALLGKELEPLKPLFWYDGNRIFTSAAKNVVLRTLVLSLLAPFVYAIFLRRIAWRWSLSFAALVWDVPPSQLSYIPPYYPSLIYRSLKSGLLLVVLFEASNALFSAYVAREPLKKGQPLTAESKDPNGSLLTGLKSRKEIPKTFALWELSHIAAHHSERRKNLFTDIDRPSGSVSTQIFTVGIAYIISIHSRISTFQSPTAPTQPALMQRPPAIESLPHISTPLRKENIFTRTPPPATSVERIESNVGSIAKSYGQSPNPGTFKFSSAASSPARSLSNLLPSTPPRKLLTQGPSSQQTPSSAGGLLGKFKIYMDTFLRSTVGTLFRHTFARRAQSIILGSPTSTLHPLISAVRSLSALAVASLTEDPYGKVAKDIPILIRTYISTIQQIKIFLSIGLPVHWTDVDFHEGESRRVPEIDFLLRELKEALKAVLTGFGPFANELGIPARDVAVARKLVEGIGEAGDEETSAGSGRDPNVRPGLGEKGSEKAAGMNGKGGGKTIDPRPEMEQVR